MSAAARPAWAALLGDLRRARGLTATHAAARMGVTAQTWVGLESGCRTRNGERTAFFPREATLVRAAEALGLTPAERAHLLTEALQSRHRAQPWQVRLRRLRQSQGLSQTAAANMAGVRLATYRQWEHKASGGARHDLLRELLTRLGLTSQQRDAFVADIPNLQPPSAPSPSGSEPPPAWSQHLTACRISRGLYLAQIDERLGQPGVQRQFELGGWSRSDGRRAVPPYARLHEVAHALAMTPTEIDTLVFLADQQRIALAATGELPFLAELLAEARRAHGLTRTAAALQTRHLIPSGWASIETAYPRYHCFAPHAQAICEMLGFSRLLSAVITAVAQSEIESADNSHVEHQPDLTA